MADVPDAGQSDDEYEEIPAQSTKQPVQESEAPKQTVAEEVSNLPDAQGEASESQPTALPAHAEDDDWLRSRTNRLLDLMDPEDLSQPTPKPQTQSAPEIPAANDMPEDSQEQPTPDAAPELHSAGPDQALDHDSNRDLIKKTRRLYVRNLSYKTTQDEIQQHFETFGAIEEVGFLP